MDADEKAYLLKLIEAHTDRLRILQMQAAKYGINCPAEILLDIDYAQKQLNDINDKIHNTRHDISSYPQIENLSPKILVVDDEQIYLNIIKRALHDYYIVLTSTDSIEALRIATTEKPDLIISDMRMPGMNGYSFLLKVIERRIPTRFMIMTAYDDDGVAGACLRLGVSDYLIKPFNIGKLKEFVKLNLEFNPTLDILLKEPVKMIENLVVKTIDLLGENRGLERAVNHAYKDMEKILLDIIEKEERLSELNNSEISPDYYSKLAKVYNMLGKSNKELEVLERYKIQPLSKRNNDISERIKELKSKITT